MKNIYVVRPVGFNVGNNVINVGLSNLLGRVFHTPVNFVSVDATSKYGAKNLYGLNSQSVHEMNMYADGVIVGGGNLLENGELDIDPAALRALRPPMIMTGVSWGRIYNINGQLVNRTDSISRQSASALAARCDWMLARDDSTQSFLQDHTDRKVSLGGCPSLFLKSPASSQTKNRAVVCVRNPTLMSVPVGLQSRIPQAVETLIDHASKIYDEVEVLCHDHRDIPFASALRNTSYRYFENPRDFLRYLKHSAAVLTYRLHGFLPAMVFGVPAANFSYDERAVAALRTLNLGGWDVNIVTDPSAGENALDRLARLSDSLDFWDQALPRRTELMSVQEVAMTEFADAVVSWKRGT